ncbi:MAG: aminotransferase class V-fold PLP-dependent enzyme [Lacisediminihabitans sp.]
MLTLDEFVGRFDEEPGYLNFASVGPLSLSVLAEQQSQLELLRHARFGSLAVLDEQDQRVRSAVAALTGFRDDQIVFQPNASAGLMHTMFGVTGGVLLSPREFPSLPFAATRASEALGVLNPIWLETDGGPITPGLIRDQLTKNVAAVAVSLVDYRTGYLVDLEGIRQVIGDRLLIVDAIQGFSVVDAPFEVADVVVSGGQKWVRSGWGTGFLALSDRAAESLTPVVSGWTGSAGDPFDGVPVPAAGASAYQVSNPDPLAQARFAMALEDVASVGVGAIGGLIAEKVSRVIELADDFAVPVISSRAEHERAGIVVVEPAPDQLTMLTASLFNHGITATTRFGTVRLSAHVSTTDETFEMLQAAFTSFGSAITV